MDHGIVGFLVAIMTKTKASEITTTLTVRGLPVGYFFDFVNVLSNNAFNSNVPIKFDVIGQFKTPCAGGHHQTNDIQVSFRSTKKRDLRGHVQEMVDNYNKHIQGQPYWSLVFKKIVIIT